MWWDKAGSYIGGVILPGVKVSLNSLVSNTAQLPRINLDVPKRTIGKNTIECMRNGIMYGNAAMLDGLIDRMEAELGEPATLVATGGMSRFITPLCTHKIHLRRGSPAAGPSDPLPSEHDRITR